MPDDTQTPAVVKAPPAPALRAGAPVQALIPRTIEEAYRLAVAISRSGLAPKEMKSPEQVMIAIMGGAEVGLPPFQAMQSFAIINGRPTMWGDGLLAVVLARGARVKEWSEGVGDERIAYCEVERTDTKTKTLRQFSVEDAKTAKLWGKKGATGQDTPWITYPARMLQMRARSWAIRDGCADMLRGIQMREEAVDAEFEVFPAEIPHQLAIESAITGGEIEISDEDPPGYPPAEAEDAGPQPDAPTAEDDSPTSDSATDASGGSAEETSSQQPPVGPSSDGDPGKPVRVKPQLSAINPAEEWAAEMRALFEGAQSPDDLPAVVTQWMSPNNSKRMGHCKRFAPDLAEKIKAEFLATQARLKR